MLDSAQNYINYTEIKTAALVVKYKTFFLFSDCINNAVTSI